MKGSFGNLTRVMKIQLEVALWIYSSIIRQTAAGSAGSYDINEAFAIACA